MAEVKQLPSRADVAEADTWDLSSLFDNDEQWRAALDALEKRLDEFTAFRGRLADSAEVLADCEAEWP